MNQPATVETRLPGLYSLKEIGFIKSYAVFLDGVWFAESNTPTAAIENAKRGVLMADSVKKLSEATVMWNKSNMFNEFVANRALKGDCRVVVNKGRQEGLATAEADYAALYADFDAALYAGLEQRVRAVPAIITRHEQAMRLYPGVYKVEGSFPPFFCVVDGRHRYFAHNNADGAIAHYRIGVVSFCLNGACESQTWSLVAPLPTRERVSVSCPQDQTMDADTPARYITPEPLPGGELQMHEGVPHYYGVPKDRVTVSSGRDFAFPGLLAHIAMEGHPHRHVLVLHNHTARHLSDAPLKMVHDCDGTLGAVVVEGWLKIVNANGDEKIVQPGIYRTAEFNIMCEKLARRSVQHWSL